MFGFKLFLLESKLNNAHAESTLDEAWEKAWRKHGDGILDAVRSIDPETKQPIDIDRADGAHPLAKHYDTGFSPRQRLLRYPNDELFEIGYHDSGRRLIRRLGSNKHVTPAAYIKWDLGEDVKNVVRNNYPPNEWNVGYGAIRQNTLQQRPEYRIRDKEGELTIPPTNMPGSHPKYIPWITQQIKLGRIKNMADDLPRIRENLQKFEHLKRNGLLSPDITNKQKDIHDDDDYDLLSIHPPIQRRDGSWQYDSHASLDFNNLHVNELHHLVNHPEYNRYFAGPTHEEAMAKLKEGHDYDVLHDSTPGGKDRDKLTPEEQQQKRGVKVYHAKTEAAAHALAICPGTNNRTQWCTAVPGQYGGNEQFRSYDKEGPLIVLHGEKGGPELGEASGFGAHKMGDHVLRQAHVISQQWMNEDDEHDQHITFERDTIGASGRAALQFPSFDGGDIREATARITSSNPFKYELSVYEYHFGRHQLTELGSEIAERWHLHKAYGGNLNNMHPEDREKVKPFASFDKEQSDNMDAVFGPAKNTHRTRLLNDRTISHKTKLLVARHGYDTDILHLTSNMTKGMHGTGGYTDEARHDLDDDTIHAILQRKDGQLGYIAARGSSNRPSEIQIAKGRIVARMKHINKTSTNPYTIEPEYEQYEAYNDLPGFGNLRDPRGH